MAHFMVDYIGDDKFLSVQSTLNSAILAGRSLDTGTMELLEGVHAEAEKFPEDYWWLKLYINSQWRNFYRFYNVFGVHKKHFSVTEICPFSDAYVIGIGAALTYAHMPMALSFLKDDEFYLFKHNDGVYAKCYYVHEGKDACYLAYVIAMTPEMKPVISCVVNDELPAYKNLKNYQKDEAIHRYLMSVLPTRASKSPHQII